MVTGASLAAVKRGMFGGRVSARSLLAIALIASAACSVTPRTEVIVVVDTDLAFPTEIDRIVLDVSGPDGRMESASASLGEGEPSPPRTLGLVHDGGALGPYEVVARGLLGESEVVSRRARFEFVPETTLVLTMHLVDACVGRDCGAQTCSESGCQAIDRTDFGAWTGTPPRLGEPLADGGFDAGRDGGIDADLPETGLPDTSVPDTGLQDTGLQDTGLQDTGVDACTAEVCNDADDDCDGRIDEDVVTADETCNGVDDDCDDRVDETFDLMTDLNNCGSCGRQCVFRNGEGICNAGVCTITACTPPFDDCDRDGTNGCETDTNASANHCGACGNVCRNPARVCCSGTCQRSC